MASPPDTATSDPLGRVLFTRTRVRSVARAVSLILVPCGVMALAVDLPSDRPRWPLLAFTVGLLVVRRMPFAAMDRVEVEIYGGGTTALYAILTFHRLVGPPARVKLTPVAIESPAVGRRRDPSLEWVVAQVRWEAEARRSKPCT